MFKEAIQEIVDNTEGGLAGLVMDMSGIPLDSYAKDGSDISTVGAEFSVVLGQISTAGKSLEVGSTKEVAVSSDKMTTLFRVINETYFMAVTLSPEGNFGKARFLMRLAAPKMDKELA